MAVFVSYQRDRIDNVNRLVRYLELRGIDTWFAPRDIPPGGEWDEAIVQALDNADAMVLLFCSKADTSRHVKRELQIADEMNIDLFPVRIESVEPKRLKYMLTTRQWVDWVDQRDATLELLVRAIQGATRVSEPAPKFRWQFPQTENDDGEPIHPTGPIPVPPEVAVKNERSKTSEDRINRFVSGSPAPKPKPAPVAKPPGRPKGAAPEATNVDAAPTSRRSSRRKQRDAPATVLQNPGRWTVVGATAGAIAAVASVYFFLDQPATGQLLAYFLYGCAGACIGAVLKLADYSRSGLTIITSAVSFGLPLLSPLIYSLASQLHPIVGVVAQVVVALAIFAVVGVFAALLTGPPDSLVPAVIGGVLGSVVALYLMAEAGGLDISFAWIFVVLSFFLSCVIGTGSRRRKHLVFPALLLLGALSVAVPVLSYEFASRWGGWVGVIGCVVAIFLVLLPLLGWLVDAFDGDPENAATTRSR